MKKLLCILLFLAVLYTLCGCKDDVHKANEYEPIKFNVSKDSVNEFLALLHDKEPKAHISGYPIIDDNCYNITPTQVSKETDMKIFKFSDIYFTFVMLDNEIYYLCNSSGGLGCMSAVPCDFDNDGNKDLLVSSSNGSGMHYSEISVFNSVTKKSTILHTAEIQSGEVELIVSQSPANLFTDHPQNDTSMVYSVLSSKIYFDDNNLTLPSYTDIEIVGHIDAKKGTPVFVPYKK